MSRFCSGVVANIRKLRLIQLVIPAKEGVAKVESPPSSWQRRRSTSHSIFPPLIIIADQFFPSSKKCAVHACNYINDNITLSDRQWQRPKCETLHDRDYNASLNLDNYGLGVPVETRYSSTLNPTQEWSQTGSPRRGRPDTIRRVSMLTA